MGISKDEPRADLTPILYTYRSPGTQQCQDSRHGLSPGHTRINEDKIETHLYDHFYQYFRNASTCSGTGTGFGNLQRNRECHPWRSCHIFYIRNLYHTLVAYVRNEDGRGKKS